MIFANYFIENMIFLAILDKKKHEFKPKLTFLCTFWLKLNIEFKPKLAFLCAFWLKLRISRPA